MALQLTIQLLQHIVPVYRASQKTPSKLNDCLALQVELNNLIFHSKGLFIWAEVISVAEKTFRQVK